MERFGLILIVLCVFAETFGRPSIDYSTRCVPGVAYKSSCNTCFCTSDGMAFMCTERDCLPNRYENEESLPLSSIRKRDVKLEHAARQKRDTNAYYDYEDQFLMDDPSQMSVEQTQDLARQQYLQQQQDYYDRQRLQQELAEQNAELEQQNQEMQSQLQSQQEEDRKQLEKDAEQERFNRLQELYEQYQQQQSAQGYQSARNDQKVYY